jgi:hypothetical protein
MGVALVPRGVRALADQLNAYYRVLKGTDPDSLYIRLNSGGSVEVRHSATNAAVFKVTDAGVTGSYQPGDIATADLADQAVTSVKIADGTIVNADVAAAGTANIDGAKLAPTSVTTTQLADQAVTSVKIADGTIANADINATANIAPSKLAPLSTDQILKDVGSGVPGGGLLVNANVAAAGTANIALAKLAPVSANQILKDVGSGVPGGGLLVDANVAAAGTANIAINKLADLGANNVLRSSGAGNVAGKIVSGDILDGTIVNADIAAAGTANIDGAKLAVNSVPSDRIMGGATIPANSIDTTHIIDGSIMNADINAAAGILGTKLVANAITQTLKLGVVGAFSTSTAGSWVYTGIALPLTGMTIGSTVLYIMSGSASHSAAGASFSVGLGLDSTASPTVSHQLNAPGPGYYLHFAVIGTFVTTATSHTLYELVNLGTGTYTRAANPQLIGVELKR